MAKILCVLYDDPSDGYPTDYPRDDLPKIERYPDGQTLPTPKGIDFQPGRLLGSVSGELGLRKFLEAGGHELVVTSDKDGADSRFERELPDADIVISQPFWPAYMFVVDKGNQKMFESRVLVPAPAGLGQGVVQGLFELASETGHLDLTPARIPGIGPGSFFKCHTQQTRNQGASSPLSPEYDSEILSGAERIAPKSCLADTLSYFLKRSSAAERWAWARVIWPSTRAISALRLSIRD